MRYCEVCKVPVGAGEYDGIFCDFCDRRFCSHECAQIDDYENTFPNCCPGVYWCILCKIEYLDAAQGHLFLIAHHDAHTNLKAYLDQDPTKPMFVEKCMNCKMWCYEVRSQTDEPGRYEGYACEVWLEDAQ